MEREIYLFISLLGLGTWSFFILYIGLCERGGCSGALCWCFPVSLSPPLCLDAFETGREGMWLGECKLRDEWLHVFQLFFFLFLKKKKEVQGCFHPPIKAEQQH